MIGTIVGAWRIEARIGEGGMGTVYSARHTVMGRRGAVKVLRSEMTRQPEVVQRFFNEARAAGAIASAGIVDVFDMGQTADGTAYLVMELLEGEALSARLRRDGPMAAETATRVARQIASALGAAHERGIVHRDLKPDNIFLVPDQETTTGERVKLLDFGIAKLHGELAADAPVTRTGALFGTPVYMAPEQCRGGVEVDHRADLYALGCILYEMLCGRVPFRAAGLGELLSAHMFEAPVPPRALMPTIPESLEQIVLCLLAKDPAHRFGSAWAAVNALDAVLGRPVSASAIGTATSGTASAGVAAAFATGATVATTDPDARPPPTTLSAATGEAAAPATRAPRRGWPFAVAGAVVVTAVIAAAVMVADRGGSDVAAGGAPPAPPPADAALVTPIYGLAFVAGLETASGSKMAVYASAGAWQAAAADFEQALAQDGAPARWTAAAAACRGYAAIHADDLAAARRLLEAARAADPSWAVPHLGLAGVLSSQGETAAAIEVAHEAQRLAPRWWMTVAAEARIHRRAGALDRAIEQYRRALQLAPDEPILLSELALVYHAARLDTEAERYAREALARDPDVVAAHLLLAERALERRDGDQALTEANRVVALDPESAPGLLARADALLVLGKRDQARTVFAQLVAMVDRSHDRTVPAARVDDIRAALAKGRTPAGRGSNPKQGDRSTEQHRSDRLSNDPLEGLDGL